MRHENILWLQVQMQYPGPVMQMGQPSGYLTKDDFDIIDGEWRTFVEIS